MSIWARVSKLLLRDIKNHSGNLLCHQLTLNFPAERKAASNHLQERQLSIAKQLLHRNIGIPLMTILKMKCSTTIKSFWMWNKQVAQWAKSRSSIRSVRACCSNASMKFKKRRQKLREIRTCWLERIFDYKTKLLQ
jgi:hypothetical protein